jgi:hypothetical protein
MPADNAILLKAIHDNENCIEGCLLDNLYVDFSQPQDICLNALDELSRDGT